MKRFVALAGATLGAAGTAQAAGFEVNYDVNVFSEFIEEGEQRSGPVAIVGADLSVGQWYAGAQIRSPFDEGSEQLDTDVEVSAGTYRVLESGDTVDVGVTFIFADEEDFEPYISYGFNADWNPAISAGYAVEAQRGWVEASFAPSVPLAEKWNLDYDLRLGYNLVGDSALPGPNTLSDDYFYAKAGADVVYSFNSVTEAYVGGYVQASSEDTFASSFSSAGPNFDEQTTAYIGFGLRSGF